MSPLIFFILSFSPYFSLTSTSNSLAAIYLYQVMIKHTHAGTLVTKNKGAPSFVIGRAKNKTFHVHTFILYHNFSLLTTNSVHTSMYILTPWKRNQNVQPAVQAILRKHLTCAWISKGWFKYISATLKSYFRLLKFKNFFSPVFLNADGPIVIQNSTQESIFYQKFLQLSPLTSINAIFRTFAVKIHLLLILMKLFLFLFFKVQFNYILAFQ